MTEIKWGQITARNFYNKKFKLKGNFLNIIIRNSADLTHENNDDATALTTTVQTKQASKHTKHHSRLQLFSLSVKLLSGQDWTQCPADWRKGGKQRVHSPGPSHSSHLSSQPAVNNIITVLTACGQQYNIITAPGRHTPHTCPHSLRSATWLLSSQPAVNNIK